MHDPADAELETRPKASLDVPADDSVIRGRNKRCDGIGWASSGPNATADSTEQGVQFAPSAFAVPQENAMKSDLQIALNRRTTASAVGELMADIERSPRENLRARRDRINRQREARMYRDALAAPVPPTVAEQAAWDRDNDGEQWDGMN
jgi:hypothetical protein